MEMDLVFIVVALVMSFAVLIAKVITGQLIALMRRRIANAQQGRAEVMHRLKTITAQKSVAEKNRLALERKKAKLVKQLRRLKRDLDAIESERKHRDQLRATMRGKLIRS